MRAVEARNLWLGELSTNGASPWTIRNYTGATDVAFTTIAERRQVAATDLELGVIDRDDLVASLATYVERTDASGVKRKPSQSTLSSFATAPRSLFTWYVKTAKIERNPMARVKRPKQPIRIPRAMGAEQCQQLLDAAGKSRSPERDTLMVLLGLTMGLRLAEIASVKPVDFHPA